MTTKANKPATQFKCEVSFDKSNVDDALTNAHCGYWANELEWDGASGYVVETEGDRGRKVRHVLTLEGVRKGVTELARLHPYIFGKLLEGDLDGPMSDVLLQLCAGVVRSDRGHEGEEKYG